MRQSRLAAGYFRAVFRVILVIAATVASPASAAGATTVTLAGASQHAILRSDSLVARVQAPAGARVVVRSVRTRRAVLRSRASGTRRARLRLTRAGRQALARCAKRTLTIRAGGAFVRTSFQRDPRRCARTEDGPPLV